MNPYAKNGQKLKHFNPEFSFYSRTLSRFSLLISFAVAKSGSPAFRTKDHYSANSGLPFIPFLSSQELLGS
jgi:hypothetical protein